MTHDDCGLQHGITLEFPRSGLSVRPRKGDVRNKRRHFTHGNFELTLKEGVAVKTAVEEWEPAVIKFDGIPSHRFVVPPDSIEFKYDLEETEKAEFTLWDARKVINRSGVTKLFDSVSLEQATEFIVNSAKDEFNVIEDVKFTVPEEVQDRGERVIGHQNPQLPALGEFRREFEAAVERAVLGILGLQSQQKDEEFGIDFDGETAFDAMQQVTDHFGVQWWVEPNGTLWVGNDATFGQIIGTIFGNDGTVLKNYSVTESGNVTDAIHIEGPFSGIPKHELLRGFRLKESKDLKVIVEATTTAFDGSVIVKERETPIKSPSGLEQAARRALVNEIMDDVEGSIQINGIASENTEALASIRTGDKFLVDESVVQRCSSSKNFISGEFIIQSVHHRFDTRRGWEITTEVARLPDMDSIESKSVIYDPFTDKNYDSFIAFFLEQRNE